MGNPCPQQMSHQNEVTKLDEEFSKMTTEEPRTNAYRGTGKQLREEGPCTPEKPSGRTPPRSSPSPEFDPNNTKVREERMASWRARELTGDLSTDHVPGIGEATVAIMESRSGWGTTWAVLGQFLLSMEDSDTIAGCNSFKQKLDALGSPPQFRDTITAAVAEKLLEGFTFPFHDNSPELTEKSLTSQLTGEQQERFMAVEVTESVEEFIGISDKTAAVLNRKGVSTCAQLFGKALVWSPKSASLDPFYTEFFQPALKEAKNTWGAKLAHQLGERLSVPMKIEYH